MDSLSKLPIKKLKELCKIKHIHKYTGLKKNDIIKCIIEDISVKKIQRFMRSRWIRDEICPISMDRIRYPSFVFIPKGLNIEDNSKPLMIYYNLEPLVEYLLTSGDFRDPKTRESYSEEFLKSLDKYRLKIGLKYRSIYKASQNKNFYKRKKEREEDLIILERCLDEVVSSMRMLLEFEQENNPTLTLNSFHFPTYHRYFRSLLYKSSENAKHVLNNTISVISGPPNNPTKDPNNVKDLIFQFIYTLEETYFN